MNGIRHWRTAPAACLALLLLALFPAASTAQEKPTQPTENLYKRLGGYDAIAAVTDDFVGRLVADPLESRFFVGASDSTKARIRQLIVDQLCAVTGGPCVYAGRDMKTAHKGLGITEKDIEGAVRWARKRK